MKVCAYCGRDNQDDAINCCECGTAFQSEPIGSTPILRAKDVIRFLLIFTIYMGLQVILGITQPDIIKPPFDLLFVVLVVFGFPLIGYYFAALKLPFLAGRTVLKRQVVSILVAILLTVPTLMAMIVYFGICAAR
jgi:hypothetical protein